MDHALVAALRRDLLWGELRAVDEALRVALPERDVAGGVLVEQRVEEQEAALRDRRGVRHQRDLAKAARALVAVEHFVQNVLTARGLRFDDASALKADCDVVDERPLIGERLGARDMAVDATRMGRRKHLFGRNVRIAGDAVLRRRRAALPVVAVSKADGEIRAWTGIMESVKLPGVQPFRPLTQRSV